MTEGRTFIHLSMWVSTSKVSVNRTVLRNTSEEENELVTEESINQSTINQLVCTELSKTVGGNSGQAKLLCSGKKPLQKTYPSQLLITQCSEGLWFWAKEKVVIVTSTLSWKDARYQDRTSNTKHSCSAHLSTSTACNTAESLSLQTGPGLKVSLFSAPRMSASKIWGQATSRGSCSCRPQQMEASHQRIPPKKWEKEREPLAGEENTQVAAGSISTTEASTQYICRNSHTSHKLLLADVFWRNQITFVIMALKNCSASEAHILVLFII